MTPTSLFILTTCCLTAILAIVLLLWHRESRRLGASNADAEARERDAAARSFRPPKPGWPRPSRPCRPKGSFASGTKRRHRR